MYKSNANDVKSEQSHKIANLQALYQFVSSLFQKERRRYLISLLYLSIDAVIMALLSGALYRSVILLIEGGRIQDS